MYDVQKLMDAISDSNRDVRSGYHLTLKHAVEELAKLPTNYQVKFDRNYQYPDREMSYRGYYSDLAFSWADKECSVSHLLLMCKRSINNTYEGYKGGDNLMDEKTPLWAACYGDTGRAIIGITLTEQMVILNTKQID